MNECWAQIKTALATKHSTSRGVSMTPVAASTYRHKVDLLWRQVALSPAGGAEARHMHPIVARLELQSRRQQRGHLVCEIQNQSSSQAKAEARHMNAVVACFELQSRRQQLSEKTAGRVAGDALYHALSLRQFLLPTAAGHACMNHASQVPCKQVQQTWAECSKP